MARLEDILPEIRKGRKARRKGWPVVDTINTLPSQSIGINKENILADDWELVPEPTRVADYFVPIPQCELLDPAKPWFRTVLKYHSTQAARANDIYYRDTFPVGQQPEGSVLVPGSERNQE